MVRNSTPQSAALYICYAWCYATVMLICISTVYIQYKNFILSDVSLSLSLSSINTDYLSTLYLHATAAKLIFLCHLFRI